MANELTIEQQKAIAMANARARASASQSPNQPQTTFTEETVYDPATGVPLTTPSYGPEATGKTKLAQDFLTATAAAPVQYAMSTAKPIAGVAQLVGKIFGSETMQEPAKALEQTQTGIGQISPSSKVAGFVGDVANPITLSLGSKAMGIADKLPILPSYAKNIVGGSLAGGAMGAVEPVKQGQDFTSEKMSQIGTNAAFGGVVPAVAPLVRGTGKAISEGLGVTTGAGGESVRQAFRAGVEGGERQKALAQNLREQVAKTDVLDDVSRNLDVMRNNLSNQYRSGMIDITADKSILAFDKIDEALNAAKDVGRFKGQIKNKEAAKAVQEATDAVNKWKNLDPNEYHTPEGLDALKQQIGGLLESIPFEQRTARKAVGDIYSSIKKEISEQAPTYSKVMKDYSEGVDLLNDIKKTFSMTGSANVDTQMRKLQSLMRNNVNTNFGNRQALMQTLEQQGGNQVMPALAGQALSSYTPRGLAGLGPIATTIGSISSGNIAPLALLPLESPRLVGEGAMAAGRALRPVINLANSGTPEQRRLAQLLIMNSARQLGE